jgi:hypothetical protein
MAQQNEHGRLIAAAAKAALGPLGCKRKGQSRLWVSDERYWAISVEFQPSAWSKGSYLNVRPQWLWLRMGAHDDFPRPAEYIGFENSEQFAPLIKEMASVAAETVMAFRSRFSILADVNRYFSERITRNGWPVYRAAVTAGLLGEVDTARRLFKTLESFDTEGHEYWMELKSEGAAMAALLDDSVRYRSAVLEAISTARKGFGLPPDLYCLDFIETINKA